jgi:hypothetical protein
MSSAFGRFASVADPQQSPWQQSVAAEGQANLDAARRAEQTVTERFFPPSGPRAAAEAAEPEPWSGPSEAEWRAVAGQAQGIDQVLRDAQAQLEYEESAGSAEG